MAYVGARGETAAEMARTMHLTLPQADVALAWNSLLSTLPLGDWPGCQFRIANRLWGQNGYGFSPAFLKTTREQFGAELQQLDFSRPDAACRVINLWVAEQTSQQIRDLISTAMIDPSLTRLMLTNAAYFKGVWQSQFEPSETKAAEFFTGDRHFFTPTMHQLGGFRVRETEKLLVLEMPYRNRALSMLVLLPAGETGALEELEASLSAENIRQWMPVGKPQDTEIFLPKFKIETSCDLPAVLGELGMKKAFQAGADFSGINDGKERLWLNAAVHKAYVEVDEKGTKAAAATGEGTFGGPPPPKFVFRADHPFVFLIFDKRTNCILFLGRVTNPEKCAPTARGVQQGRRGLCEQHPFGPSLSDPTLSSVLKKSFLPATLAVLLPRNSMLACNTCGPFSTGC